MAIPSTSSTLDFREHLRAGDVIAWPQGPGEPRGLTRRLVQQRNELPPLSVLIGMTTSDTLTPEHASRFTLRGLNGAGSNRRLTAAGVLDVLPIHVSSFPRLLRAGNIRVDIALIRVRPHHARGTYTTGVIADYTRALVSTARCVIAELDQRLPITSQDALLSEDEIDVMVEADADELLLEDPVPSPVEVQVASQVASCIPDGATLQLGIGTLPVAISRALMQHRELGVHSGVVSDVIVDLVERGVITNARKGADAGFTVTGALFGSRRLIDFAHDNALLHMRSVDYTHNQQIMAGIQPLYSVNSAIEVDLSGQVNAEVAGDRYLGAVGGHADFVRGAQYSPGGRSIIALPSRAGEHGVSRIVASLSGRPVTTARSDVDLIVSEHGCADLRGQSLRERAKRLIAIAHPDDREALRSSLKGAN